MDKTAAVICGIIFMVCYSIWLYKSMKKAKNEYECNMKSAMANFCGKGLTDSEKNQEEKKDY